ncbi:SDR family NAD(P)-dependent oxidoreductase [Aquabacterium sp. A7-Y]|uniref:type I polyketide synthase n=1 Tax=Aquabacterium sp. A7-Y TaxID=1349605 RepID=UPI00223E1A66|nr:type I polyketide synthase [Aquabacterium sp. A7-Y]MCW7540233.1 SDR family NAD(P)-dependent oxidoreductase [Aquabacterium sp. A7-Y]
MSETQQAAQMRRALAAVRDARAQIDALQQAQREPVAIVGAACRLPGAPDLEAFWRLLQEGVDAVREVPAERWDAEALYDPKPMTPGKSITRWGGIVDDADRFDAAFFGISPSEAAAMDPQQRIALEVAWDAFEDAGLTREQLAGSRTGVFVGATMHDYGVLQIRDGAALDPFFGTGNVHCIVANRLSYAFDLRGPSLATDTACSSSLVAVQLACQSLRSGECDIAIAGGVNMMFLPELSVYFSQAGMMSADGRCKTFDARADGYVRGEGCGFVVLKRRSQAQRDGHVIRALVRAVAVNQDGRTNGLTAPNGLAQRAVIAQALDSAGIAASQVSYIEAHGTGTSLGDPIEVEALSDTYGVPTDDAGPCAMGSVKTNIGHLEAAAGIASLLKTMLALEHEEIPPTLHLRDLNPSISLEHTRLSIATRAVPWPRGDRPRLAGINSFGFGGTNAHAIVEEAPLPSAPDAGQAAPARAELLVLSGHTPQALQAMAQSFDTFLAGSVAEARDISFAAGARRTHQRFRIAVAGRSTAEWRERLQRALADGAAASTSHVEPRVGFVFSGQGPQWLGMGQELFREEPVFRAAIEACETHWRGLADWSLQALFDASDSRAELDNTELAQPALFALQWGLVALWKSWGIAPAAVVGHSIGEIAACCVAGVLSLPDALALVAQRGRLMQRTRGQGAMLSVALPRAEVDALIAGLGGGLSIAAVNSPSATVVAGTPEAVTACAAELERRGTRCTPLPVQYAFHSRQMEPLRAELRAALSGLQSHPAELPIVSTLLARRCDGTEFDADYWVRQACEAVLFQPAVQALQDSGCDVLLEVGPHPVLSTAIDESLAVRGRTATVLTSLRRREPERLTMLTALGALHARGCTLQWPAVTTGRRFVALPRYAWQRERFWFRPGAAGARAGTPAAAPRSGVQAIVGPQHSVAADGESRYWEWSLDAATPGLELLRDHVIQNLVIVPAAAIASMVAAIAAEILGDGPCAIDEAHFHRVLVLAGETPPTAQLVLTPRGQGCASFRLASREGEGDWVVHATGSLRSATGSQTQADLERARERCTQVMSGAEHYAVMDALGYALGPAFRCIRQMWRGEGELVAQLQVDPQAAAPGSVFRVHPGLLDSCFQCAVALMGGSDPFGSYFVPGTATGLRFFETREPGVWAHVRTVPADGTGRPCMELQLYTASGERVLEARSVAFQEVRRSADMLGHSLYRIEWQPQAREAAAASADGAWLVLADAGGVGERLAQALRAAGGRCVVVQAGSAFERLDAQTFIAAPDEPQGLAQVLARSFGAEAGPCRGVLHLWSLDGQGALAPKAASADTLAAAQRLGVVSAMHLVQALLPAGLSELPRLWLVTRGAAQVEAAQAPAGIEAAPLWGLGRVLTVEHPELRCSLIDLAATPAPDETAELLAEVLADGPENQVALLSSGRSVARLARVEVAAAPVSVAPAEGRPYELELTKTGSLDSLTLRETTRPEPGPGEVVIEVQAAGLNFRDVLVTLGIEVGEQPGRITLGFECSGTVVAVGPGVQGQREGRQVVALAAHSIGSHARADARLVWSLPAGMSAEEAATLPVAFGTAHFALHEAGRLARGERVLIHAAAGGVGLAAVQVAQAIGAEIFATAGTPEKRDYLRSLGIEHVLDSRSLDFADEVMRLTEGAGVDVVLNSLAGPFIERGLSVLRPHGRFIEIGKRDLYGDKAVQLAPFRRSLSYAAVDLIALCDSRPERVQETLREVFTRIADGAYRPLPRQLFGIEDVRAGFQCLANAGHIGKIVFQVGGRSPAIVGRARSGLPLRADASYLVTGGLGGLGLVMAQWLVAQGARHLVLLGRSAPTAQADAVIAQLREAGATVFVARGDVAQAAQLRAALDSAAEAGLPPLRGVLHAAGLLDDGVVAQLDADRLLRVMAPKVEGAWHLHAATARQELDFFVLFSSIAAALGSPGQGNYAAGNAFLNALARWRQAQGLPATCVLWGPWADVGMAARVQGARSVAFPGMTALPLARGTELLGELVTRGINDVLAVPINWGAFFRGYPEAAKSPLLALFAREGASSTDGPAAADAEAAAIRAALSAGSPHEQVLAQATDWVREQVARTLWRPTETVAADGSLIGLGFDSLMLVDLRNRLQAGLGVSLSITALPPDATVAQLASYVVEALQPASPGAAARPSAAKSAPASVASRGGRWVELQAGQSGPPLILIHALVPSAFAYVPLARALGAQQTVYGVAGPSLNDAEPVPARLTDIAAQYVEELLQRWPTGPFVLGGHSFGGTLAYEMARQLHERGRPPELLVMLDALSPPEHAARLPADWRERRPEAIERVAAAMGLDAERGQIDRLFQIVHAHMDALIGYDAPSLPGPLLYVRAEERDAMRPPGEAHAGLDLYWEGDTPARPEDFWFERIQGRTELVVAPGWHHTMLDRPERIAKALRAGIDALGR